MKNLTTIAAYVALFTILSFLGVRAESSEPQGYKLLITIDGDNAVLKAAYPLDYAPRPNPRKSVDHGYWIEVTSASGEVLFRASVGYPSIRFYDYIENGQVSGGTMEASRFTAVTEIPLSAQSSVVNLHGVDAKTLASFTASEIAAVAGSGAGRDEYPIFRLDTLQYTGNPEDRIDIVFMGDGYVLSDTTRYWNHVEWNIDFITSRAPYDYYWGRHNVYVITAISNERGIDHPHEGLYLDTYFDVYWNGSIMTSGSNTMFGCAFEHVPQADQLVLFANDGTDAGSASWGDELGELVVSGYYPSTFTHEYGHSFGHLWDEYFGSGTCSAEGAPNCDTNSVTPKWQHWIDAGAPVGVYGGCTCINAARPTWQGCLMRYSYQTDIMCIVCMEHVIQRFYEEVPDPIISSSPSQQTITTSVEPQVFEFSYTDATNHPLVISWELNGTPYPDSTGTSFHFDPPGYGSYQLTATLQDTTEREIKIPDDWLVMTHTWNYEVVEYLCGDADGSLTVSISDAVHIINYIFGGGPAPDPLASADADCSGDTSISDAVYIISYIFGGGPGPCEACP